MITVGEFLDLLMSSENEVGRRYLEYTCIDFSLNLDAFRILQVNEARVQSIVGKLLDVMKLQIAVSPSQSEHDHNISWSHRFLREIHGKTISVGISINSCAIDQPLTREEAQEDNPS